PLAAPDPGPARPVWRRGVLVDDGRHERTLPEDVHADGSGGADLADDLPGHAIGREPGGGGGRNAALPPRAVVAVAGGAVTGGLRELAAAKGALRRPLHRL